MIARWNQIADVLVDPIDHEPLVVDEQGDRLRSSHREYGFAGGQPVLLADRPLTAGGWSFPPVSLAEAHRPRPAVSKTSPATRARRMIRRLGGEPPQRARFVEALTLPDRSRRRRVLVVGGATLGEGTAALSAGDVDLIAFDIYPSAATTFVADGHRVPLSDECVDGVWIQAVLEHVYRPELVVAEIERVLRPGGVVYAETPFLQPVHEGAYDFARFTESGHRMLFHAFDRIDSGPIGGPGALCALAARTLVAGLTRRATAGRIAYALTLPLTLVDRFVPLAWRTDACTGTFFLGRRRGQWSEPSPVFDPLEQYRGAQ